MIKKTHILILSFAIALIIFVTYPFAEDITDAQSIEIPLPTSLPNNETFFAQAYSTHSWGCLIQAVSEINSNTDSEYISLKRGLGKDILWWKMWFPEQAHIRFIRIENQQYRDYRIVGFNTSDEKIIKIQKLEPVMNTWEHIEKSQDFTIRWVETSHQKSGKILGNVINITGLPERYYKPIKHNEPGTWLYKVDGIFYTEKNERYIFYPHYGTEENLGRERGSGKIDIKILQEQKYQIYLESTHGD